MTIIKSYGKLHDIFIEIKWHKIISMIIKDIINLIKVIS